MERVKELSEAETSAAQDIRHIQEQQNPDELVKSIGDLVNKRPAPPPKPQMTMADVAAPFSQRDHDLLLQSIDHVAEDWVAQLNEVRHNSEAVEQLVLQRAAKVKADITQLYLLGHAAMAEAKRGADVNAKLVTELEKLAEQSAAA
jgi:hypothetical protein